MNIAFDFPDLETFIPFPDEIFRQSMAEVLNRAFRLYADRIAIQTREKAITYRELDQITNEVANKLIECLGTEEENIPVLVEQGLPQILCILGILKAGKVYSVLDMANPPDRLAAMIADLGSRLSMTDSRNSELAREASGKSAIILEIDDLVAPDDEVLIHREFNRPAGIYYTSGSTGQPKGVVYDHRGLLHYAITANHCYQMTKHDTQPLPFSCSFGWSAPIVFSTFFSGGSLYPVNLRELSMPEFASMVEKHGFSILQLTPSFLRSFMAGLDKGRRHFPNLRLIVTGGEPLQIQDLKLWQSLFEKDSKLGYILASTEACYITFRTYGISDPLPEGNLPVGFVVAGKKVLIVDDERKPLPVGEIGEIVIHNEYGSIGYWNKPELTDTVFRLDPEDSSRRFFYSNDLGRLRPDGQVEHFGRKDNQAKIRGYRVELLEIENALRLIQNVKDAAVVARPVVHRSGELQLIAYVVIEPAAATSTRDLRLSLAKKLPDYMVPPFIVFMEKLPLNLNGKVDRQALPDIPNRQDLLVDDLPRDEVEERLLAIWQRTFGLKKIGVCDDFFELGGDSLLAISLFLDVDREFRRQFPSTVLLKYPTIRSLAGVLREGKDAGLSSVIPVKSSGDKPPIFWVPSGFGVDLYVQGAAKYLEKDQPLYLLATPNVPRSQILLIEELAQIYAREIQEFQPDGPYYLVGHSGGGIIACETARELIKSGGNVTWVGLLDTVPPTTPVAGLVESLQLFFRNIAPLGFRRSLMDLGRNIFILFSMSILRPNWVREKVIQRRKMFLANLLGIRESSYVKLFFIEELYAPEPYPFDLIVFRANGPSRYDLKDRMKGWGRYVAKGIRFVDVPGDHVSMMEEPNIPVLVDSICRQV